MNVVHVEMPHVGTRKQRDVINLQSYLNKKRCFHQIKNKVELCCARAIVVAQANLNKDPQYSSIVTPRGTLQGRLAHELHETAGAPLIPVASRRSRSFKLSSVVTKLNVASKEHLNVIVYSGPKADKCLCIYHHDNHYDAITSMPAFLARKQYCHKCKKGYDKITDHPCGDVCKLYTKLSDRQVGVYCQHCHRFFKSDD